ncbi:MAG: hypothetical protein ABW219_12880, partial [Ilumatobacteraceae bacterium]
TVDDAEKFGTWVYRIESLRPTAMVGAHGPVLSVQTIYVAIERMRRLPDAPLAAMPGQDVLDQLITMLDAPVAMPV